MKRSLFSCVLLMACAGALAAQQSSQGPYEGTSNPPPDDTITTEAPPAAPAKPAPGKPMTMQGNSAPAQDSDPGSDGIVMIAPDSQAIPAQTSQPQVNQPALSTRSAVSDPDGDIVHPAEDPNTLAFGTLIRARLEDRLSTAYSQDGEPFRATVASDVLQDGQVLIPAGSEIDGTVGQISTGHFAGHGSMILRPDTVVLPGGAKYHLYAEVSATPGANARVGSEGEIKPGSRTKKDAIEYGGGVGAGLVTGAVVGGPAGALAGTLVGAGAVTVHLMMDHPQATLEAGTVLEFSLTHPLHLQSVNTAQAGTAQQTTADGIAASQ